MRKLVSPTVKYFNIVILIKLMFVEMDKIVKYVYNVIWIVLLVNKQLRTAFHAMQVIN